MAEVKLQSVDLFCYVHQVSVLTVSGTARQLFLGVSCSAMFEACRQDHLSLMPLQYCVHHVHAPDACMARTVLAAAPSAVLAGSSGPDLDQRFWLRVGNASPCVSSPSFI